MNSARRAVDWYGHYDETLMPALYEIAYSVNPIVIVEMRQND